MRITVIALDVFTAKTEMHPAWIRNLQILHAFSNSDALAANISDAAVFKLYISATASVNLVMSQTKTEYNSSRAPEYQHSRLIVEEYRILASGFIFARCFKIRIAK